MATKKFKALGVYIFAGGFTLGVKQHFEVLTHFEDGLYGVETAVTNRLIKQAFTDPAQWPVKDYTGKVDFLYGNPPCAPWSMASSGRGYHWTVDPRVNAVRRMTELLRTIKPKVWAWESVRPTFVKGRELVDAVAFEAMKHGYHATVLMVDGQYHGVAQVRKRMFLVLSKVELPWTIGSRTEPMTVREAFKGVKRSKNFHQTYKSLEINQIPPKFAKLIKPGQRACHVWNTLHEDAVRRTGEKMKGRPGFLKFRLAWDMTSPVLLGGASLLHPVEHRYISIEESAALCGYPRDFQFKGGLSKQYAQIAQAVMPPVAEYLARQVKKGLEKNVRIRRPGYERVEIFGDRIDRQPLTIGPIKADMLEIPTPPPWEVKAEAKKRARSAARPQASTGQPSRPGSGMRIRELLQKGWDTERILATIKKEFPQSKATGSDISWNRRQLQPGGRFHVQAHTK